MLSVHTAHRAAIAHCRAGRFADLDEITIRPLGWPGLVSLRLEALVGGISPANLARGLAKHPDEAVEFFLRHLQFGQPPVRSGEFDAAADGPVAAFYHPAPDRLANSVSPRHSALLCQSRHLGEFEGAIKTRFGAAGDIAAAQAERDAKTGNALLAGGVVAVLLLAIALLAPEASHAALTLMGRA